MRKELDVWIRGERVGSLSQGDAGALSFRYLRIIAGSPVVQHTPVYTCVSRQVRASVSLGPFARRPCGAQTCGVRSGNVSEQSLWPSVGPPILCLPDRPNRRVRASVS